MFPQLTSIWEERDQGADSVLKNIDGFPYQKWADLKAAYSEAEQWFTGKKLEGRNKNNAELYPLKVNPIIGTCLKHAYMLFGQPQDDGRPQVYPRLVGKDEKASSHAEEILKRVWAQSNGRALLIEAGILSQIYGGAVIKVNWNGFDVDNINELNQCKLETLPAPQFYGIPYAGDYYRLKEAWIIKKLDDAQARNLGYKTVDYEENYHVEYWNEKIYWQKINGQTLTKTINGEIFPLAGENEFGFVPIWYIPHLRVGTFFGINTFDHILGLVKEINLRYADYGDAVNDDSHSTLAGRNIPGSPKMKQIGGGQQYIDLGSARNITGSEPDPDLFEVSKTNKASTAMKSLTDVLYDQYRRDAAHPAVADGEDEGSQRSGLTIAMRFYPMTSHVGTERYFWTPALNKINMGILKILKTKGKGEIGTKHLKLQVKQKWAPQLPRDREADVQEWAQRAANNIGSLQTLLEQTGDIEDIEKEMNLIYEHIRKVAEIDAEAQASVFTAQQNAYNNQNGSQDDSQNPPDKKKKQNKSDGQASEVSDKQ